MGPVAGRTAPAGVRNRAGPKMGAGKRVVAAAAAGAGRRARGPGRAQMAAAAVGIGLGRKRAASVLVSCFCKASLDCKEEREDWTPLTAENPPALGSALGLFAAGYTCLLGFQTKSSPFPPPNIHSKGLSHHLSSCPQGRESVRMGQGRRLWGVEEEMASGTWHPHPSLLPEIPTPAHLQEIPLGRSQGSPNPTPGSLGEGGLYSCLSSP